MNSESSRISRTSKVGGSVWVISAMRVANGIGKRDRVDAALFPDRDRKRRLAVERGDRRGIGAGVLDGADIANPDRDVAAGGDDDVGELLGPRQASDGADRQLPHALFEPAARQLEVLRAQRRGDIRGRERVGVQAIRDRS